MSRFLFYPHVRGVISRLPEHYKRRHLRSRLPATIKYIQGSDEPWKRAASDNALYPSEAFELAPDVLFPEDSQNALWGGEGIVRGFIELKRTHTRCPKTWGPDLRQHIFYSEILDRWMIILVSVTALKQIENLKGIDNYILESRLQKMN
uniref:Large ribosomal subunit protein bL28m n=1 Tax=Schistocephalus solidus TaxID=70667 RepID=A0A0X3PWF9_SCHSO